MLLVSISTEVENQFTNFKSSAIKITYLFCSIFSTKSLTLARTFELMLYRSYERWPSPSIRFRFVSTWPFKSWASFL